MFAREQVQKQSQSQSGELREPGAQGQSKELREPGAQGQIIDISTGFFSVELVELISLRALEDIINILNGFFSDIGVHNCIII